MPKRLPQTITLEEKEINRIGEKCGVFAVQIPEDQRAALYTLKALKALQHRGQESAGISIYRNGDIRTHTGDGLVTSVITGDVLDKLDGSSTAIGHVRYSTVHGGTAQPIDYGTQGYRLCLAHNGNLFDTKWAEAIKLYLPKDSSDTAFLTQFLLSNRNKFSSWEETFKSLIPEFENSGSFSLVAMTETGDILGLRDPYGNRPLVLGKLNNGWTLASESVALDMIGATYAREVKPGELILLEKNGRIRSSFIGSPQREQNCLFEHIYFSRPDSFAKLRIKKGREISGELLGKRFLEKNISGDFIVVPVLESGKHAAHGVAKITGFPYDDAIITSHYVGRTFISPENKKRVDAINGKHNVIPDDVYGKDVLVVDDSAVRLNTSPDLVKKLRKAGARSVHFLFASPPVVDPCDKGIDTQTKAELPASEWEDLSLDLIEQKVAKRIGAETVTYLPTDKTAESFGGKKEEFCYQCFGGPDPIRDRKQVFLPMYERQISGNPRVAIFISGSGTNLERIIEEQESGRLNVDIVGVISNKEDAYGLIRAQNHNIPTRVISSKGIRKEETTLRKFEQDILSYVDEAQPEIIVLAGWMVVLGDNLLHELQNRQVTVINLHPALLPSTHDETIATSRGTIPVIRGIHAITEAFEADIPLSGVTVHQLLPGNTFDVGPVILTEEVHKSQKETRESWEAKIHEAEHRILTTALKRVAHVITHNINPSLGTIIW